MPLLRDVFEAFPNTPVNVDIKVNNDTLIKKVSCLSLYPARAAHCCLANDTHVFIFVYGFVIKKTVIFKLLLPFM